MLISDDQLKQMLLQTKVADADKLQDVAEYARTSNVPFQEALIERDVISDENLGIIIADFLKVPFIVLSKITIPPEIIPIVPERLARKLKIIPYARDQAGIKIAMANPQNTDLIAMLEKKTGQKIQVSFSTERDIYNKLRVYRKDLQQTFEGLLKDKLDKTTIVLHDVPMEKIVDLIIYRAYEDRASDIHIEPQEKNLLIRYRLDGILHDVLVLPKSLHDQVITRIKVLSKLRTDEHLAPQDGKMRIKLEEEDLDIRVSILPIADGEKAVLRLLASKFRQFSLVDLGMTEIDLQKVTKAFKRSYGMVLSTGPTGSGKTTSIYSILKIINTREKNITTIEDPIEYRIQGVNQINVNAKTNLTFASGLRSILRQDPNIVFVGEIRDAETAGIAVNAALTGHLVLSTLHTNDAATALPRLSDMDVEPFLVASTVNVIVAQRLVRKICDMCKQSLITTQAELIKSIPLENIQKSFAGKAEIRMYYGQGCKVCHNTGYSGRIGIFEVLEVTKEMRELILKKNGSDVILQHAKQNGMTTMLDDGLQKVVKGLTSLEEIIRVTKFESA